MGARSSEAQLSGDLLSMVRHHQIYRRCRRRRHAVCTCVYSFMCASLHGSFARASERSSERAGRRAGVPLGSCACARVCVCLESPIRMFLRCTAYLFARGLHLHRHELDLRVPFVFRLNGPHETCWACGPPCDAFTLTRARHHFPEHADGERRGATTDARGSHRKGLDDARLKRRPPIGMGPWAFAVGVLREKKTALGLLG